MITRPKPQNNTQAVISNDQNFILVKNIGNFTDIISPFKKIKDNYTSKFILPINQLHRVQALYDTLSNISQFTVVDDMIRFDCVNSLPSDIFGDSTEGYIHFSTVKHLKKDKVEIFVDPKLIFEISDNEVETFTFNQKIRFKSDFLKAFPIILKPGFIFTTVNKTLCQMFISVTNPKEMLVGECSKYEIINVIQYILPIWPIFNITIDKNIQIRFQSEFIQSRYCNETSPILLYMSYNLDKPEIISITKFANNVAIS